MIVCVPVGVTPAVLSSVPGALVYCELEALTDVVSVCEDSDEEERCVPATSNCDACALL